MVRDLNDGGQAFPGSYMADHKDRGPVLIHEPGMTLRDYAAIHADLSRMQFPDTNAAAAYLGEPAPDDLNEAIDLSARVAARLRYQFADAMLAERAKAVRS